MSNVLPFQTVRNLWSKFFSAFRGQRDYNDAFGWDRGPLTPIHFKEMYDRAGIAQRIVRAYPKATWKSCPKIIDDAGDDSPFSDAFEDFVEEKRLMHFFERADRLSGIGNYSLLLMGFADGNDLSKPLRTGKNQLLYLAPYAQYSVTVGQWDYDPRSPRYAQPVMYTIQHADNTQISGQPSGVGASFRVHYSRVLHLAEFLEQDEVYGTPPLLAVYNYLKDLMKVSGSSAECFWLAANRGLALMAELGSNINEDVLKDMKQQAEDFQNKLRRVLVGEGMTANVLDSTIPDPSPTIQQLLQLIAGTTGIPMRILLGTEEAQLAGSQDGDNWASRVEERRCMFASPMILRPFVQLMIDTGNLPTPQGKWWIDWEQSRELGAVDRSIVAMNKALALKNYAAAPGAEVVIAPEEFREWVDLDPESSYELQDPVEIDPQTGLPVGSAPGGVDPATGLPMPPKPAAPMPNKPPAVKPQGAAA